MAPRLLCLLVAMMLTVPALAGAQPDGGVAQPRKLTKAELKRFRAIMTEAKRAAKKGKHAAAVAAYDRALAIKPGNQAALTDQGWSLFLLRAYERAEAVTRRAIQAEDGNERRWAAAQYNLGRILEVRGDRDGAIAAYVASLEQRPNRVVREQLATLDPAAAAQMDPLRPVDMLGPFARLEDFCKTRDERDRTGCPGPAPQRLEPVKAIPRYQAVSVIGVGDNCHVAVKLVQGWFVESKGTDCANYAERYLTDIAFAITDLVPGGNPEVTLRTSIQESDLFENDEGFLKSSAKACYGSLIACGVSQKGPPRCLYMDRGRGDSCVIGWNWELTPVFSAGDQLEVKAEGALDADARALMGRRKLVFP